MIIIIIILQITITNSLLNVTGVNTDSEMGKPTTEMIKPTTEMLKPTTEMIKSILNTYKQIYRNKRDHKTNVLEDFAANVVEFFKKTERFSEVLKYSNVSQCIKGTKDFSYVQKHILEGFLLNPKLIDVHWNEYKSVFNKSYVSRHHETSAFRKWHLNLHHVALHNKHYLQGKHSYSLHLNHFGDWVSFQDRFDKRDVPQNLPDYMNKILRLVDTPYLHDPAEDRRRQAYMKNFHKKIPKRMDWREHGFRPRREQQWHCGACYAFAVAHALQAQMYKKKRDSRELSSQQIVDCSGVDGNYGCDGGSLRAALRYVAREGLLLERSYPYRGKKGRCHYWRVLVRAKPRRWAMLPPGDEFAMERALATIGPLAVAVNASPRTFQLYRSGIYDDPFCTPWRLNHAMLLVGYTPQYWVLLNWWGRHWGEDGYIRIRRGLNRCGVSKMAAYVEL